jgi:hypothetical protein
MYYNRIINLKITTNQKKKRKKERYYVKIRVVIYLKRAYWKNKNFDPK